MRSGLTRIRDIANASEADLSDDILCGQQPVVFRGLAASWPFVQAGKKSPSAAQEYLTKRYNDAPLVVCHGGPETKGRPFYNDDLSGLNFESRQASLDFFLNKIQEHSADEKPPLLYIASTTIEDCLPTFRAENDIFLGAREPLASIWIGNKTTIAAHYDLADNIACVTVGRREFTLFPPEQLENLYVGPIDLTPAGQPVSLVDLDRPDFDKYPKFREALKAAQVADLEPGDAIFIPSMWWHQVKALESFNVLVNYWWRQSPAFMGPPVNALNLAILAVRDLPPEQKKIWQNLFNHYVFENTEEKVTHIPAERRGVLGPITDMMARRLRAYLLNRLNR
ncbi:cupin-like domain-containing protein [Kordiimonas sp.]|uniref:cupin-like domain-containing protein n=1 Tax=Kordiimonas sp. TaxID=1970157 RepID=UPI003A952592